MMKTEVTKDNSTNEEAEMTRTSASQNSGSQERKEKEMILFVSQTEEKESFLSRANRKLLTDPLNDNNPITVQILGVCSALAVTVQLKPAIVMALGVIVVMAFSNLIISAIRKLIPSRIRIIVQLVVVAGLVVLVSQFLEAYAYNVSKQ